MAKISPSINSLYRLILPLCTKKGIQLNVELNDPSLESRVSASYLKNTLAFILQDSISRCQKGDHITLSANSEANLIFASISDSGNSLTREQKTLLTTPGVNIRSRYGYGTTVKISL